MPKSGAKQNRYAEIVSEIFRKHHRAGAERAAFDRSEFEAVAK